MSKIRTELTKLGKPIDELQPHPRNVRQGDIGAITVSLEAHGQYAPIIYQKSTNFILKGNHTWAAAKSLGWAKVAAVALDVDDDRALRILLADNKSSDLAPYDTASLAELLSEFAREYNMDGLLWDQEDLDSLLRQTTESLVEQNYGVLAQLPTEGAKNPVDNDEVSVEDDTNQITFYFTTEELDEVRTALASTTIANRNEALLKVVREWVALQN